MPPQSHKRQQQKELISQPLARKLHALFASIPWTAAEVEEERKRRAASPHSRPRATGEQEYAGLPAPMVYERLIAGLPTSERPFAPAESTFKHFLSGERPLEGWLLIRIIQALDPSPEALAQLLGRDQPTRPHYLDAFFADVEDMHRHQPERTRLLLASLSRAIHLAADAAGPDAAAEHALLARLEDRLARAAFEFATEERRRRPPSA